jgi:flagellar export protein FliJ
MTGLASLVRVHRWILDEKRQALANLLQLTERFKEELGVVEESLAAERAEASRTLDGALAFQTYIAPALDRRAKLRQTVANLDSEIEVARDEVGAAFQELKKFETAQETQERRKAADHRRRDQIALDDLGVSLYRRNRAAGES